MKVEGLEESRILLPAHRLFEAINNSFSVKQINNSKKKKKKRKRFVVVVVGRSTYVEQVPTQ